MFFAILKLPDFFYEFMEHVDKLNIGDGMELLKKLTVVQALNDDKNDGRSSSSDDKLLKIGREIFSNSPLMSEAYDTGAEEKSGSHSTEQSGSGTERAQLAKSKTRNTMEGSVYANVMRRYLWFNFGCAILLMIILTLICPKLPYCNLKFV